ncbi:hypothetical protein D3C72_2125210 [compost metagenome]
MPGGVWLKSMVGTRTSTRVFVLAELPSPSSEDLDSAVEIVSGWWKTPLSTLMASGMETKLTGKILLGCRTSNCLMICSTICTLDS